MTFEEQLRDRIKKAPFNSTEKSILKTILGEIEQKKTGVQFGKPLADEVCHNIVKKTIQGNNETLGYLPEGDNRRTLYLEENEIMQSLLPAYWSVEQIRSVLPAEDVKAAKSEGQAIGLAMKTLKGLNAMVENDTVRSVVVELRKVSS